MTIWYHWYNIQMRILDLLYLLSQSVTLLSSGTARPCCTHMKGPAGSVELLPVSGGWLGSCLCAVLLCACWLTGCRVHIVRGEVNLWLLPACCGFEAPHIPTYSLTHLFPQQQLSGWRFFNQRPSCHIFLNITGLFFYLKLCTSANVFFFV